ncbi:hypothetical protein [Oceanobacillus halotolerans]|uniref:hypothetical protein n=1 Tax=Oceanobacillus halotolerans TaxID=2663380 RepID=UPI0013DC2A4A|nr:hypothetical protein [Oceanobacillus halotolerans]
MKNKTYIYIILLSIITAILAYMFPFQSKQTITYFPEDDKTSFTQSYTEIELLAMKDHNHYEVNWQGGSQTNRSVYLKQDASLLFDNGKLRGVRSKWEQDTDHIKMSENLYGEDSSLFQSISIHHAETHYPDDDIRSIQEMSDDQLYIIDSPSTELDSFRTPQDSYQKEWKELLDYTTKEQLLFHWHRLARHFQIDYEDYHAIPLTGLSTYNTEPLPTFTKKETDQIIGQLWEGLYKNYILPAANTEQGKLTSYIPIILISKDSSHLLVLYELNGEMEKLIQQIPTQ